MPTLTEDRLRFEFPAGWKAAKLDDWSFYTSQFQRLGPGIRLTCGHCDAELRCLHCGSAKTVGIEFVDFLALDARANLLAHRSQGLPQESPNEDDRARRRARAQGPRQPGASRDRFEERERPRGEGHGGGCKPGGSRSSCIAPRAASETLQVVPAHDRYPRAVAAPRKRL